MRTLLPLVSIVLLCPLLSAQTGPGGVGNTSSNILWFDAGNGITLTGGAVSTWADRSGNANHATQATAAQRPLLQTNVMNGRPVVYFDNDQVDYDYLRVPDNATLEGMNGLTGFVVYHLLTGTATTAPRCFFSKRDGVDIQEAYDWFVRAPVADVVQQLDIDGTPNRAGSTGNIVNGVTHINGFTYHGAAPSDAFDQVLYNGNVAVGNRQETSTSVPNYTSDLYLGILRGHTGTGVNVSRFNGYMAEVILYNQVLNDAQRIIVNNYLAAKYGTTLATLDLYTEDLAGNGDYDHDVAGIGRTTSAHVHTGARGTGLVEISGATGLGDNEFLFWGHNNGALGTWGVFDRPASVQGRWGRTWRVSEVTTAGAAADVGAVNIVFDLSGFASVNPDHLRLLVDTDNDGVFADETPIGSASALGGGRYQFTGVTALANGVRFTLGTTSNADTPLPVGLIAFGAKEEGAASVRLDWSTASEHGNARFDVERSDDAMAWRTITTVAGAGTSTSTLHYTAYDVQARGALTHYRLRQVDFDGTSTLSNVVSVAADRTTDPSVYPNPAVDEVTVCLPGDAIEHIELIDMDGRLVRSVLVQGLDRATLSVHGVAPGTYLLRIASGTTPILHRLAIGPGMQR